MKWGNLHSIKTDLNELPSFTRFSILLTGVFLFYGYICRLLNIYFFWESKTVGWILFFITMVPFMLYRIKVKKANKRKTWPERLGIGLSLFALVMQTFFILWGPNTSAYNSALKFIHTNWYVHSNVGIGEGVFLVPFGGMSLTTTTKGEAGEADLHFIVKGTKSYMDLNLLMGKDFDTDWIIEIQE